MNENPKISIIMPVYNAVNFIQESIDSILKQTFKNWELIIINDGSTDNTLSILHIFVDSRISITMNNHDFIASLNKGLSLSKGKYIVRMDADDIMLSERLQTQYDYMESNPEIDICGSWVETIGDSNSVIQVPQDNIQIGRSMLLYNPIIHSSVIMKRSIFFNDSTNRYSYDYPCAEDYKLWTDLYLKGFKFNNIQKVLLQYRRSKYQVTSRYNLEVNNSSLKIRIEYAEHLMEKMCIRKKIKSLIESLIDLVNDGVIEIDKYLIILYYLYNESSLEN